MGFGAFFGKAKGTLRNQYRKRGLFYFAYRSLREPSYPLLCLHGFCWGICAWLFGKSLVHFIGDSHTAAFSFQPRFITHHIGQATAHNLNKEQSSSESNKILFRVLSKISKKRDVIAMVFGEIDCRIHFFYQHKKHPKEKISALMNSTISNYGQVLRQLKAMGYKVCVCGVAPAARQQNLYSYPFYGTPKQRSAITKEFNAKLREFCTAQGFGFIDIYSIASDKTGFTKAEFAADEVHLNGRIVPYAKKYLNNRYGLDL